MSTITIYSTAGESEIIHWENGKAMTKKDDFDEVLQALKAVVELIEGTEDVYGLLDMADSYYSRGLDTSSVDKARDVIAKFKRVGGSE